MCDPKTPLPDLEKQSVQLSLVLFRKKCGAQILRRGKARLFLLPAPLVLGRQETIPLCNQFLFRLGETGFERFQSLFARAHAFGRACGRRLSGASLRLEALKFRFGRRLFPGRAPTGEVLVEKSPAVLQAFGKLRCKRLRRLGALGEFREESRGAFLGRAQIVALANLLLADRAPLYELSERPLGILRAENRFPGSRKRLDALAGGLGGEALRRVERTHFFKSLLRFRQKGLIRSERFLLFGPAHFRRTRFVAGRGLGFPKRFERPNVPEERFALPGEPFERRETFRAHALGEPWPIRVDRRTTPVVQVFERLSLR